MQAPKTQRIAITVPMANNTCVLRMMGGLSSLDGAMRSTLTMPIVTARMQPKLRKRANVQFHADCDSEDAAKIEKEREYAVGEINVGVVACVHHHGATRTEHLIRAGVDEEKAWTCARAG